MNDTQFEELIKQAVERRQTLDSLNQTIMKEVKHKARREWIRKWARIVLFSFGMPLLLLLFALGIYYTSQRELMGTYRLVLIIPVVIMLYFTWDRMKNFSIAEL